MVNTTKLETLQLMININMKSNKIYFFSLILILNFGCENHKPVEDTFNFNSKTGELILKKDDFQKLKKITLEGALDINNQSIKIDSNFLIREVTSHKNIKGYGIYKNNWIHFDSDGNLEYNKSFFYESNFYYDDYNNFILKISTFPVFFEFENKFILYNGKTNDLQNSVYDTIKIDEFGNGKIKIKDKKLGRNDIKFIIVYESKKNTKHKRYIFAHQKINLKVLK